MIKGANLALRFLLGLCAPWRLGLLGLQDRRRIAREDWPRRRRSACRRGRVGRVRVPSAPVQLPCPLSLVLQVLVFGAATAGLAATGYRTLALGFGVIVVLNVVLMYVWGQ